MKTSRVITVLILTISVLSGLSLFVSATKPRVKRMKLGDCTDSTPTFRVTWPHGHGHQIALGVRNVADIGSLRPPNYAGTLLVMKGENAIFTAYFDSAVNNQLVWLNRSENVAGFVLTLPRKPGQPSLESAVQPGDKYDVAVHFSNAPLTEATLWLDWLQNRLDKGVKPE